MKALSITHYKEEQLLSMDALQLVGIYATKLMLLTKKQRVIFDLLSNGMMIKDIALVLGIAEITVKVTKAKVMRLLGVNTLQDIAVIGRCTSCNYVTPQS
ncbi:MAG: helix-turn-helix transcriptional regulator [Methylophilales bacterium]|nr:helix-turn-helix transcriptional regulator [Methylophilales bacterium]